MRAIDRFEKAAAIVVDVPGGGVGLDNIDDVVEAIALLRRAGFGLILLAPDTSVQIRRRSRRWRSLDRKERA